MYIPDSVNNRVRMVAAVSGAITPASVITTFAGGVTTVCSGATNAIGDGCLATQATLNEPLGLTLDAAGNLYIADTQNGAIRQVNASTGDISTQIKDGTGTYYQNNAFSPVALYGPIGITLDGSGNLYIADSLDMVVREIQSNFSAIDYTATIPEHSQSSPVPVTIENDGNAALDLSAITPSANALVDTTTTTCALGTPGLAFATDCVVGAIFAPTVVDLEYRGHKSGDQFPDHGRPGGKCLGDHDDRAHIQLEPVEFRPERNLHRHRRHHRWRRYAEWHGDVHGWRYGA
jgi:hypothetical protein